MRVELLFWAGCPSHEKALQELRAVLAEEGLERQEVVVREIEGESEAAVEHFIGSPTVRVDGVEVQPEPNEPVGLTCRVYTRRDGRISPTPDPEDIRDLVRHALADASARASAPGGDFAATQRGPAAAQRGTAAADTHSAPAPAPRGAR
jgi:hypothetical protein